MKRRHAWLLLAALAAAGVAGVQALRPPHTAAGSMLEALHGVTLVEPGGPRLAGRTLRLGAGRIERIETTPADVTPGRFGGSFVLPGLSDLHVHHPPVWAPGEQEHFALLFLAHGVTSVRDVGTAFGTVERLARRIERGDVAGPRILHCGRVLDGEPPTWPGSRVVRSPAEAEQAVSEQVDRGARCIKVFHGLDAERIASIRAEAQRRGLPLLGHVPDRGSIAQMQDVEVQHLMGLARDWWDVSEARLQWYADISRELGIAHTPTLAAFERHARLAAEEAAEASGAGLLPRYYAEILWNPETNPLVLWISPAGGSSVAHRLPTMQRTLRALERRGVPIRVGSDTGNPFVVPGRGLQAELRLLVETGLPLETVWSLATRGAGEALGVPGLGRLREGAPADLLVFAADPTRDLGALPRLQAVVAAGRLYPIEVLEAELARRQRYYHHPLYDRLSRLAARGLLRWLEPSGEDG